MLNFDAAWRFESPRPIPSQVVDAFSEIIGKIKTAAGLQTVYESFKSRFASAAGTTSSWSSSLSWAESDLQSYMSEAATNAPLFIEAFYDGVKSLESKGIGVPSLSVINGVLKKFNAGYEIRPPDLVSTLSAEINPVEGVQEAISLDREAQRVIQNSLSRSEKFLADGENLAAVQELLWLMETVSTAFQGLSTETGTVQGKYFNKIVFDLRKQTGNITLKEVLGWITTMHGYLSSPSGGGIRHGADINNTVSLQPHEARLFCNLIRSYIRFLIDEHARLSGPKVLD
jgi:hypothetical protein